MVFVLTHASARHPIRKPRLSRRRPPVYHPSPLHTRRDLALFLEWRHIFLTLVYYPALSTNLQYPCPHHSYPPRLYPVSADTRFLRTRTVILISMGIPHQLRHNSLNRTSVPSKIYIITFMPLSTLLGTTRMRTQRHDLLSVRSAPFSLNSNRCKLW